MPKNPFDFKETQINGITLFAINLEELTTELESHINANLSKLCYGKRKLKLENVKKTLLEYLENKKTSNLFTGAVSELIVHLFLVFKNFEQEFLYRNLEENSIKKGFDGYYSKFNESWILESKSSLSLKTTANHISKIKEAYNGVTSKINGSDAQNNPWNNAYNHAKAADSKKTLLEKINLLSEEYSEKKFHKPENFNLIPASTIILNSSWCQIDVNKLELQILEYIPDIKYKKLIIICINKKSLDLVVDFLKK